MRTTDPAEVVRLTRGVLLCLPNKKVLRALCW